LKIFIDWIKKKKAKSKQLLLDSADLQEIYTQIFVYDEESQIAKEKFHISADNKSTA
jgi:hypothetical protein